jgi:hypothetical protein
MGYGSCQGDLRGRNAAEPGRNEARPYRKNQEATKRSATGSTSFLNCRRDRFANVFGGRCSTHVRGPESATQDLFDGSDD